MAISLGTGVLFAASSALCRCLSFEKNIIVGALGFFLGALALPEMEKGIIKRPATYQVVVGVFMGLSATLIFNTEPSWHLAGALSGAIIGYLAPYWLKGVQLPC